MELTCGGDSDKITVNKNIQFLEVSGTMRTNKGVEMVLTQQGEVTEIFPKGVTFKLNAEGQVGSKVAEWGKCRGVRSRAEEANVQYLPNRKKSSVAGA